MSDLSTASGVSYTKYAAIIAGTQGLSSFLDGANEWGTKLRVCYDTYTMSALNTASLGFVLTVGVVPKGARVLGWYCANAANAANVEADFQLVDAAGDITTASAAGVWTNWTNANQQFVPALSTVSSAGLDAVHTVTVTTGTNTWAASVTVVVVTFYLVED